MARRGHKLSPREHEKTIAANATKYEVSFIGGSPHAACGKSDEGFGVQNQQLWAMFRTFPNPTNAKPARDSYEAQPV